MPNEGYEAMMAVYRRFNKPVLTPKEVLAAKEALRELQEKFSDDYQHLIWEVADEESPLGKIGRGINV